MTANEHVAETDTSHAMGSVFLTVVDSMDWSDHDAHFEILRAQIGKYKDFVESGTMAKEHPGTVGLPVIIRVAMRNPAPKTTQPFFDKMNEALKKMGINFALLYPNTVS